MKGKIGAIILGIVMVFCLIACIVCLEKIPAGYVGVVYNMNGGVDGAEANRMIAGSLTGELIEKIKYEQWNGELPTVTGSSSIISIEP